MAKILVVDDRHINRQFLQTLLGYSNHQVLEAADGAEALKLARAERPDLVITDIVMPTMDGYEFVQRLRADSTIAQTPVIFYTATYRDSEAKKLALRCGVSLVLSKPSEPEKILSTVNKALGLSVRLSPAHLPAHPSFMLSPLEGYNVTAVREKLVQYLADSNAFFERLTKAIQREKEWKAERDNLRQSSEKTAQSLSHVQTISLRLVACIELGLEMALERDPQRLLEMFCKGAHDIIGSKYVALGVLDGDGQSLRYFLARGMEADTQARLNFQPPWAGVLSRLLKERHPHRARGVDCNPQTLGLPASHPPISSFLGLPLASPAQIHGWIYFADKLGADEFDENDQELAVTLVAQAALAYENDKCHDELQCHAVQLGLQSGERQRAEEALRGSEERYRLLFQNNPQPAWVADLDTLSFLAVNDAAVRKYGYSREEFLAMSIKDIRPAEDVPELLRMVSQLTGAGRTGVEVRHRKKDGTIIDAELTMFQLTSEGSRAGVAIANDITQRKRSEKRLAAEHATTRVLAESATLEEASPRILKTICENLGWDLGEIWKVDARARLMRCVEIWHMPSFESSEFEAVSRDLTFAPGVGLPGRVWSSRQPAWIADVTSDANSPTKLAGKSGLYGGIAFPILVGNDVAGVIEFFSRGIREPDNNLLQMFSSVGAQIGQFIERRSLEEQFRQAQKMEAVGRLAGGIAHDFNNLMTAVLGYSDLLLLGMKKDDPAKADIEEIRKAGDRATSLTRQLLAFSRQQVIELKVLNLNQVVVSMDKMLRRVIGEDIDLVTIPDPRLGSVKVDPTQIEQILMNLVVNARDAMPEGGKLTIEMRNVDLDESYTRDHAGVQPGPYVMLAVSDTGVGMDAETQRHIFEPFFTTKEKGKGTGLGLATVFGIVQQSGGNIRVYSEPGSGTTFKIYLPRVEEAAQAVAVEKSITGSLRGSETILLVEDEEGVRKLARRILESNGYTVLQADHAEQATVLTKQHKRPIDLLLTDIVLTDVSGPKLADQLHLAHSDMKVLYMSGYTDEAVVRTGMLEAGTAFLQKPFTPELLLRKVREVLG